MVKIVKLPEERINRYYDKLNHCKSSLDYLYEWIGENREYYIDIQPMRKFAIYKAVTELVEVISDIMAMILKDMRHGPKDDYNNIEKAKELKIITSTQSETLARSKGLRNRVVHDYNGLDDAIALSGIFELLTPLKEICEVLDKWIEKNFL